MTERWCTIEVVLLPNLLKSYHDYLIFKLLPIIKHFPPDASIVIQ